MSSQSEYILPFAAQIKTNVTHWGLCQPWFLNTPGSILTHSLLLL